MVKDIDYSMEVIGELLGNREELKEVVSALKELLEEEIIIIDVKYQSLGIGIEKEKFEHYLDEKNIMEVKLKYVLTIFMEIIKNKIQNKDLKNCMEEEFYEQNNFLIKELKQKVIDEEKMNHIFFNFFCLNDKLEIFAKQVIKKELEGHNINAGLIKIGIGTAVSEKKKELIFEIDKKTLGELIEGLEKLYGKL